MRDASSLTNEFWSEVFGANVTTSKVAEIGDGLVGMNVRVTLHSDTPTVPKSIVAKLPSQDETSRATGIAMRNYEREVKFYRDIAHTVDIHVPHCYYAEWNEVDSDFVLVLEDLAPSTQGNQIVGCSQSHARLAVLELAKLHGPRWGDASLLEYEWLQGREGPDEAETLKNIYAMCLPGFIGTYGDYLEPDALKLVGQFASEVDSWLLRRVGPHTIGHGDYRLDNIMFASAEGGAPISVVDWQTPSRVQAMGDVAYFLGAGVQPHERREMESDLVREYLAALQQYDVTYSFDDAWEQYVVNSFAGVVMSVVASQLVKHTDRGEKMFAAMATRHLRHALDLEAIALLS